MPDGYQLLDSYVVLFSKLGPDKSAARWPSLTTYRAPYKPLLLLAVLDQFAEGTIQTNLIEPSPQLGELFAFYWARVIPSEQRGDFAMPFFHLRSNGFWHLLARPGKESYLSSVRQIRALSDLKDAVLGAHLDEDLYDLLCLEPSRDVLRDALIKTYFAPEAQTALLNQGVVNREAYQYSEALLVQAKNRRV
jgi:putative restriction endonuclease